MPTITDSDTGLFIDGVIPGAPTDSDSGTASEAESRPGGPVAGATLPLIMSGGPVSFVITDTDAGTATDAGSLPFTSNPVSADAAQFTDLDGGSYPAAYGAFYGSVALTVQAGDTATGVEPTPATLSATDSDSAAAAEAGSAVPATLVASADSATLADAGSFQPVASGEVAGFPLVFMMPPPVTLTADIGTATEAASVAAGATSADSGRGTDRSNFPGGAPAEVSFEGFSISRLGVLLPGTPAELGTLYGVRQASLTPQWVETVTWVDDWAELAWAAPGKLALAVTGGFLPFEVLAALYGTAVSAQGTAPSDFYSLPMFVQRSPAPLSLVAHLSGRDEDGGPRTLLLVLYKATFGPVSFDGPAYKNGLSASYTAQLVMSDRDETGAPVGAPAFGRMDSVPSGGGQFPGITLTVPVSDGEVTNAREFAGVTTTPPHLLSSTDAFAGSSGQSVTTGPGGTVFVADGDFGFG